VDRLGRLSSACGWFVCAIAGLVAAGWATGVITLASFTHGYKPMAPTSVVVFALLGPFLVAAGRRAGRAAGRWTVLPELALVWMAAVLVERLGWLSFGPARLMGDIVHRLGGTVASVMAWPTLASLLVLSIVAVMLGAADRLPAPLRTATLVVAWVVGIGGSAITLAYLYGTPPFYGGHVIPVSLPTSLAAAAFAIGAVSLLGPERFPLAMLQGDSAGALIARRTLPLVVLAFVLPSLAHRAVLRMDDLSATLLLGAMLLVLLGGASALLAREASRVGGLLDAAAAERAKMLEDLRSSEERFRSLFESAPMPYLSVDAETRIGAVNAAWVEEFGFPEEDAIGRPFSDFMTIESSDRFTRALPGMLEGDELHGEEFDLVRADGSVVTVDFEGRTVRDASGCVKQMH
jgi:PAS domain S-box-containing protein